MNEKAFKEFLLNRALNLYFRFRGTDIKSQIVKKR